MFATIITRQTERKRLHSARGSHKKEANRIRCGVGRPAAAGRDISQFPSSRASARAAAWSSGLLGDGTAARVVLQPLCTLHCCCCCTSRWDSKGRKRLNSGKCSTGWNVQWLRRARAGVSIVALAALLSLLGVAGNMQIKINIFSPALLELRQAGRQSVWQLSWARLSLQLPGAEERINFRLFCARGQSEAVVEGREVGLTLVFVINAKRM